MMGGDSDGKVVNVLICGVGGQGVILASDILTTAAMMAGFEVKKSEVHGMAQRGGSVTTHVRYGRRVSSPLIPVGKADVLLAFELVESLRYIDMLAPDARAVVNEFRVIPITVSSGPFSYPDDIVGHLERHVPVTLINAYGIAREMGNVRTMNTILLGALSTKLEIPEDIWVAAIYRSVPPGTEKDNAIAFREGRRRSAVS
jgi:indolepyruvate ferredoxin oxidoreductase beta subunit